MLKPKMGKGILTGENVRFGKDVTAWNYVVIGDNVQIDDGTVIGSFARATHLYRSFCLCSNCSRETCMTCFMQKTGEIPK